MTARYTSSGKPRGVQITWRLTDVEKALVEEWLAYALHVAFKLKNYINKTCDMKIEDDEARSSAHLVLCKVIHSNKKAREAHLDGRDGMLKYALRKSLFDHLNQLNRIGGDRRSRPTYKSIDEKEDSGYFFKFVSGMLNLDEIDGKLIWEEIVKEKIALLPEEKRMLKLVLFHSLSYEECVVRTGIPRARCASLFLSALASVKKELRRRKEARWKAAWKQGLVSPHIPFGLLGITGMGGAS